MKKWIDLSHPITHEMPVFPGDPNVGILNFHNYQNGYFVSQITMGTHAGTHIDVPMHKLPGTKAVNAYPLDSFIARAFIMDLTYLKRGEEILLSHLDAFTEQLDGCRAVILKTDWSDHFGREDYFSDYPGISEEAAYWFVDNRIRLIGLESPSVHVTKHALIHTLLLQEEILIVESLTNIREIKGKYVELFAVPLKLNGLDGSPVRAFAMEG